MKDYYKINQISKLYKIGIDSLRYYEKLGILTPKRDDNGYRLYSLKEIYKLNIIRDLRSLDFSFKQIKAYLDDQCITNSLVLIQEEQALIETQLETLRAAKAALHSRMEMLNYLSSVQVGECVVRTYSDRFCLRLNAEITRDEETDFAINKLHMKHDAILCELGNLSIGAVPSMENFYKGGNGVFNSVFIILENETDHFDFMLPAGRYLSVYYRGTYAQSSDQIRKILNYANTRDMDVLGDPFELYHIDNRYTVQQEEFLTEVQMRVAD
ncbi:MerR family transcriptional regulator [Acidaminobacter sp.]|uniref:MerR family transcriptional regulator n=1 Tax=Acidaminobacter sp. TaxID=1872102 RepID=UPI001382A3AA|nr:MerR family transcriptional regulator [Acidaminobacter sp.]MDK9711465.1 MerR family transcriptional regulator [Acidaminobacter sp.]MZQ96970.1 MerR family transcriptional regulator [Acidaminobacter sp.]